MATEWTYFTTDLVLESVNDYFYTFPLAFIAVLVLTILIGRRLMESESSKNYSIFDHPEYVILNWLLTAFNSTGFWIVGLQLYQVIREEGFTYAVCNNLMTADRPWFTLWTLLHVLSWIFGTYLFVVAGILQKRRALELLLVYSVFSGCILYGWYGLATMNPVVHWYSLLSFFMLSCLHFSTSHEKFNYFLPGILIFLVLLPLLLLVAAFLQWRSQDCHVGVSYTLVGALPCGVIGIFSIFSHLFSKYKHSRYY